MGDATSTVPVVDLAPLYNGTIEQRKNVAKQIDDAFSNVGFVYLKNHGVPQEKVEDCFEWSAKFFALPTKTKMLAPHPPGGSHHRGYSGLGTEKVSQDTYNEEDIKTLRNVPDVKESFESGNVNDESQPNIWLPEEKLPGFRSFTESFFKECEGLVHIIMRTLAVALGLEDETTLSSAHSQSLFQLRFLHYPSVPLSALFNKTHTRIGAHSDFGTLTLLFQDSIGGLEVLDRNDRWVAASPIPGTVLVNIGDLMERWSNGRWRSTMHRVGAPPAEPRTTTKGQSETMCKPRYSIPFFATANPNTVISALPGCWDEERPKKYEDVTAWEYVQMRMVALYDGKSEEEKK